MSNSENTVGLNTISERREAWTDLVRWEALGYVFGMQFCMFRWIPTVSGIN